MGYCAVGFAVVIVINGMAMVKLARCKRIRYPNPPFIRAVIGRVNVVVWLGSVLVLVWCGILLRWR